MNADLARDAYGQGAAHHAQGNARAAVECFDQAVEADRTVPEYWHNRGAARLALGQSDWRPATPRR